MIEKFYAGTTQIINQSIEIGKLLGIIDASHLRKSKIQLGKENQIKTIQSSVSIGGNGLSIDQVAAIFENKRAAGRPREIWEVENVINVYQNVSIFNYLKEASYLRAHELLMSGLIEDAGKYRTDDLTNFASPAKDIHRSMSILFAYLKNSADNFIIKSCVFHYEMESIRPFMDGNGRMGRLWQTIILMQENPVFEFLAVDLEIKNNQADYYAALAKSDSTGLATAFVEYMLSMIRNSLEKFIESQRGVLTDTERIGYFKEHAIFSEFSRKEYMQMFKNISTATATRDLKKAVENKTLLKIGNNRLTKYQFK